MQKVLSDDENTWSALNFRLPTWTSLDGAKGILNGETLSLPAPGVNLSLLPFYYPKAEILLLI